MTEASPVENDYTGSAATIARLAEHTAARVLIPTGNRTAAFILAPGQSVEHIDRSADFSTPARKIGAVTLTEADSFISYVTRYSTETATTIWGDVEAGLITAVINDHETGGGVPGWRDHRAVLELTETEDWSHWLKNDGAMLDQVKFAEHLEEGADCIREPDSATMLEIAQSFQAKRGVNFGSSNRLSSGEVQFTYVEDLKASAGKSGQIHIPETFVLGLLPFEGNFGDAYAVTARFRYRLVDGHLSLGYRLVRPDKIRRAAFSDVVGQVCEGTSLTVMHGAPR